MKSMKGRPAATPTMTLGGSPISVAVPPMLAAITIGIANAHTDIRRLRAAFDTTGAMNSTVVTLSAKADSTAVATMTVFASSFDRPRAQATMRAFSQSKTRVPIRTETIAIMLPSRKMTFQSTARTAVSNSMMCSGVAAETISITATTAPAASVLWKVSAISVANSAASSSPTAIWAPPSVE